MSINLPMEGENGWNLLFRLFRAPCSAGGTNYLAFDYRLGRTMHGRRLGPRFPGIPASHQNVCSSVRSGQVTGRRVRAAAGAAAAAGDVDQIACRCPSLSCLPAHWVDTVRQLLRVGPRAHPRRAATVTVPFHGVPNGPKLPWGRSEASRVCNAH